MSNSVSVDGPTAPRRRGQYNRRVASTSSSSAPWRHLDAEVSGVRRGHIAPGRSAPWTARPGHSASMAILPRSSAEFGCRSAACQELPGCCRRGARSTRTMADDAAFAHCKARRPDASTWNLTKRCSMLLRRAAGIMLRPQGRRQDGTCPRTVWTLCRACQGRRDHSRRSGAGPAENVSEVRAGTHAIGWQEYGSKRKAWWRSGWRALPPAGGTRKRPLRT